MGKVVIYHNPRCSKSREALALLEQHNCDIEVVLYLQQPPVLADIAKLLSLLGFDSARQLMRTKEAEYKELALADSNDESVLRQALVDYPKLIERPIVIVNDRAIIARPPEQLLTLLA
ncbi:arsenate reductase (glutaredoxin) [Shewanella sp. SNU WT4]|uniref:arsenate reductase (glutaredoxin) n=1 Tax=Shewanella sp. SNU WT4 TaxID=2590015 RepID=UPI00112AEE68|nr:arsenate reductase (glutaredoxin) [Shewanella sp. SNU WT4]QDF66913.1 arsenate reductase (glutaredoxin) [Shewanella sp. SNU WT4]